MFAKTRRSATVLALAAGIVLCGAAPAFAQMATGTTGFGASTDASAATGPNAPLTLGTTSTGSFSGASGGGVSTFDEEPLPSTGGGEIAIAAGALLAGGGLGLRWAIVRRRDG